jgi:colanic acid biosynthesis glycosyl transferase WcaI
VLAICPLLQSGIFPARLARCQKIPFIFHIQDLQVDAARELGILQQSELFAFLERLERYLLSRAEAVTTISLGMRSRLLDKGIPSSRLHLLPNWADLTRINPGSRDNPLRRRIGLKPEETMVLYSGNLGEKQGLEIILESARLTQKDPSIRYVVAGEGAAKSRLVELARRAGLNQVLFLPLEPEASLPLLLAAGDIHLVVQKRKVADLVMPSKIANIMAAGRPFIATALPETELARVTVNSQAGLLIPPEDAHELAQAILKLAAKETTRQEMGHRARAYAEARLDREAILTRFEDLLYGLTGADRNNSRSTIGRFAADPRLK